MLPSQMMALPAGQVLVTTQAGQRYVFLGRRLNPIPLFSRLPGPAALGLPRPHYGERVYTQWTPAQPGPPAADAPPPANAALPLAGDTSPSTEGDPPADIAPSSGEPPPPATDTSTDEAAGSPPQPPTGDEDAPSGKNTF